MINPNYPPKISLKERFSGGASSSIGEIEKDGYIIVSANHMAPWHEVHKWCRENVGIDNYTWYGSKFVFDRKDFAEDFALLWG